MNSSGERHNGISAGTVPYTRWQNIQMTQAQLDAIIKTCFRFGTTWLNPKVQVSPGLASDPVVFLTIPGVSMLFGIEPDGYTHT